MDYLLHDFNFSFHRHEAAVEQDDEQDEGDEERIQGSRLRSSRSRSKVKIVDNKYSHIIEARELGGGGLEN